VREEGGSDIESMIDVLGKIPDIMEAVLEEFDDGDSFILCTPLVVSILQGVCSTSYKRDIAGGFKGPNNIMLVGTLADVRIYSVFYPLYYNQEGEDTVIIGNYKEGDDDASIRKLHLKNISFV